MHNKKKKHWLPTMATSMALAVMIAGCSGGNAGSTTTNEQAASDPPPTPAPAVEEKADPTVLSVNLMNQGRVWTENNPVTQTIESNTNTIIKGSILPSGDEGTNRMNLLFASGDIPDINRLSGFTYQQYSDFFLDIGPILDEHGQNLRKAVPQELWDLVKWQGKEIAIPYQNDAGKIVHNIRQDWLDNLGLSMPTTLDEFSEVLRQFRNNDPDGNGKKDTYGLGSTGGHINALMMIYGAYGVATENLGYYVDDNTIAPTAISPEYKEALQYISKLWAEDVIDPELFIIKSDQGIQKIVNSQIGTFAGWWTTVPSTLMNGQKMGEVNPDAKFNPIVPVTGPSGKSGMTSRGTMAGTVNIGATTDNAVEAIKMLDYLATDEGWSLAYWGQKDVHYTEDANGAKVRTEAGTKAFNEKWLDPLSQVVSRLDLLRDALYNDPLNKDNALYLRTAGEAPLMEDAFYGIPLTEDRSTLYQPLLDWQTEMEIKFITGVEPFSNWDSYVEQWKQKDGQRIFDSMVKAYNDTRGTSMTAKYE